MGRQPLGEQPLPRQGWSVKGADRDLTQELRLQAIREHRNVGDCLNEAISAWLESRKGKRTMNEYDGYTIDVHEMTGNLLAGDTTGLDTEAMPKRYCQLLREKLASEFPGAKITVSLQNAEGVCHEPRVYTPDGDGDEGAIATIGTIEEALWGSSEWYVETNEQ